MDISAIVPPGAGQVNVAPRRSPTPTCDETISNFSGFVDKREPPP